jgi:methylated-DNA-[protein]-cysteine S-methyltransferase
MTPSLAMGPVDTPIGRHWIAVSGHGVLAIDRAESPLRLLRWLASHVPGREPADASPLLGRAREALAAYLGAGAEDRAIPIDDGWAPAFDREVWRAVRAIPFGETTSYGAVAAAIGRPRAARAVGSALARCPLAPLVPCHRVIHASGDIGGWGADVSVKRWLLEREATSSPSPLRRSGRSRRPPAPSR